MRSARRREPRRERMLVAVLASIATIASVLLWTPAQAQTEQTDPAPAPAEDKVAHELERKFERSGGERQDFWVSFEATADTSGAREIDDWAERGQDVVDRLKQTADEIQADTVAMLDASGVDYTSYWITNAIRIESGDYALAQALAARPMVERVFAPVAYEEPDPVQRHTTALRLGPNAEATVEWGIKNIKADQVWNQYGVRGDGIVVANIDSGVQFDHPALVNAYRGYDAETGRFNHDYNWFDAAGTGSGYPTDNNGHGTHTMGTMVGDDGAANRVGVAPGVTWIAANGCCPRDQALVDSAQWMLAPTRVDGTGADPAMRPHIINNSWGTQSPSNDPFMEDILTAWADSGIFGVWANGNEGERGCESSGSPGSRILNYSVGAYDSTNTIAEFSSRGPGQDGEIKPNISAPGVNVRSALPNSQYGASRGTSMAAPHAAGSIALLWSADPSLIGDIAATRQLLDDTAIDAADDQCGGTADDNNVYGEGRLDALALVEATDPEAAGTIVGAVTHDETGAPVPGATITLTAGDLTRSVRTGDDGTYTSNITPGDYQARVHAFGYEPATVPISVTAGQTTTTDIALTAVEGQTVTGRVVDQRTGRGIPQAAVTLAGSRFAATSSDDGSFTIDQVPGSASYTVTIDPVGRCNRPVQRTVTIDGDLGLGDIELPHNTDFAHGGGGWWGVPYGYGCSYEPSQWIAGDTPVETPSRTTSTPVELPFPFTYFGKTYRTAYVSSGGTNADVSFWTRDGERIGSWGLSAYQGWYRFAADSKVLTKTRGVAPNRTFTIEFRNLENAQTHDRWSFEITLHERGDIVYAYKDIDPENSVENGAKLGVSIFERSRDGRSSYGNHFVFSSHEPVLSDDYQIRFSLPPNAFVAGTVTDRTTRQSVAGATVDLYDSRGNRIRRTRTGPEGRYRVQVFTDRAYRIEVFDPPGYRSRLVEDITVTEPRTTVAVQHVLTGGRFKLHPDAVTLGLGESERIRLTNSGRDRLDWHATADLPRPDAPAPGTRLHTPITSGLVLGGGVEEVYGSLWVSGHDGDGFELFQTTMDGQPTGATVDLHAVAEAVGIPPGDFAVWPSDLAWVPSRGWLCMTAFQLTVDDIVCVEPGASGSGSVKALVPTGLGEQVNEVGLAYDAERDLFFVVGQHRGGGFQTRIRTVAGVNHPDRGALVEACTIDRQLQGLAWNPTSETLWSTTQMTDVVPTHSRLRQVDPATCAETSVIEADPAVGLVNTGLDLDPDGNFLSMVVVGGRINTIATNDPIATNPRWLNLSTESGSLAPHRSQRLEVNVDWANVPDDVTQVRLVLRGNGGDRPKVTIPIKLDRQASNRQPPRSTLPAE